MRESSGRPDRRRWNASALSCATSSGAEVRERSATGVKPMSEYGLKRLIRATVRHAIRHGRPSVTLVQKGSIMKYTEGAFRN